MEKSKSLQYRTSEPSPGQECWQRLSLGHPSYEEEPTLREIRWPEAIWEAPAILEAPISEEPIPKPGFCDTPTPDVAFLRRHHGHPGFASSGAAQCRLWQLYAISLFDDGCLVVCPCSIFGPLWTGLAIDNEPLPTWT
ncbi:uncharacterized protein TrAFT101_008225 [Trichoderma asperellum]|uniref:uncharacterized protein n=1 Tax=Trichoderma asperellum TaxID=101201 RepID=UPI003324B1D2|nr:hypothetical protein TrAFT101_008225 [Trichoderma asperellum]